MARKQNKFKEPIELNITSLSSEGRGLAEYQGKKAFVFGGLPDETVRARVFKSHSRFLETKMDEVLSPSSKRIQPICEHFGDCGGCQLQHISVADQIDHKQQELKKMLQHVEVTPKNWVEPLTGPTQGYRNKARLGIRYVSKKGGALVGFRESHSNKIVEMQSCRVLHPKVGENILPLRNLINTLEIKQEMAQIEVAAGDQEVALVFRHLKPLSDQDTQKLIDFCQTHNFSLYTQAKGPDSVIKLWPNQNLDLSYSLPAFDITIDFHPLDFTQVNPLMNQKMIQQALSWMQVKSTDRILDLFCGLGNFSLPLAKMAKSVVGVEGDRRMVDKATQNAKRNNISNVKFYEANLFEDFKNAWLSNEYDQLLLDPPRSGAFEVVSKIEHFNVERILYVSCQMSTFVRDAAHLVHDKGYRLEKIGIMDMFPHTKHVETMGLFVRTRGKPNG